MRPRAFAFTPLLVVVAALLIGCDRRVAPFVPIDREPPAPERPVRIPGLEEPRARGGPGGMSAPRQAPAGPASGAAGPGLSGTIRLAPGLTPGTGVLFVIARPAAGGPLVAAKRLPPGPFPLAFEIGPADQMMGDRGFSGPLFITARLDRDGDPMSRGADDLVGALSGPVTPGHSGLVIVLSAPPAASAD